MRCSWPRRGFIQGAHGSGRRRSGAVRFRSTRRRACTCAASGPALPSERSSDALAPWAQMWSALPAPTSPPHSSEACRSPAPPAATTAATPPAPGPHGSAAPLLIPIPAAAAENGRSPDRRTWSGAAADAGDGGEQAGPPGDAAGVLLPPPPSPRSNAAAASAATPPGDSVGGGRGGAIPSVVVVVGQRQGSRRPPPPSGERGAFRPHPNPPSCPTALPDTCCRVRTLPERAEFVRSLQGTIKFALLSGCCVCGSSRKAKSTRSGPLTAPRGPLGCFGHGGSYVILLGELSPRVHGMSGFDVNAAPNQSSDYTLPCRKN